MTKRPIGIILNGVTGRMGTNQHYVRSILAIMQQGGVVLEDGEALMPNPILVGRNASKLAQLAAMAGRTVVFRTALSLARGGDPRLDDEDVTTVRFRALAPVEIARYVDAETPLDCAGSFKSEGLGIALFEAIESRDPTALVGLPLIATSRLLRQAGFALP